MAQASANAVADVPSGIERQTRARRHAAQDALPRLGQPPFVEILHARTLGVDVVERRVESPFLPIALEILPEVRELQRGAERVRRAIEPRIVVPGDAEHEPSDRVRRAAAVIEQARPRVVPMRRDILTKRAEQIVEERHRKMTRANGRTERHEHTVVRSAFRHARVQPILPIIQQPQPFRVGPPSLVGKVVCCPGKRVERGDVRPHARRHQPGGDREIFVVGSHEALALGVGGPQSGRVGWHPARAHRQERYCTGDCRCATR